MSQASSSRSPLLLAGLVTVTTVALGLAAFGLNQVVNPPPAPNTASPCPKAPAGHPASHPVRTYSQAPPVTIDPALTYVAGICTSKGVISLRMRTQDAPITVNNFLFLARAGFYDGLTFHRVCPNPQDPSCGGTLAIAQGGDPKGDGSGGPGYTIGDETPKGPYSAGTVAMARPSKPDGSFLPDSTGSQFFINIGDNSGLLPQFNLFADIISGSDVAKTLAKGDKILWIAVRTSRKPAPQPIPSPAVESPGPAASAIP